MKLVKNLGLANKCLNTGVGTFQFNEEGIAEVEPDTYADALVQLIGYEFVEAKMEAPVNEAPVNEAPVNEAPVNEAPVNEAPVNEAPVNEAPVSKYQEDKLEAMKVADLEKLAKSEGIDVKKLSKKAEFVEALLQVVE